MSHEATIRRGVRNARYAAIPNHVFEDSRLSMEARWLLSYLLSKPDNWTVVIGDIVKKGNCGRDKARKMLAELVTFGYAEREQQRDDGKFGSSVMVIYDEPSVGIHSANSDTPECVTFLPQTDLPATVLPCTVLPSPVKSAHSNNLDLAKPDDQTIPLFVRNGVPAGAAKSALQELLVVLDQQHAKAVIDHRKAMRRPMTPHAAQLLARRFALMPDPNAAADAMIGNGWQGFEPEWMDNRRHGKPPPGGGHGRPPTAAEKLKTAIRTARETNDEAGDRRADQSIDGSLRLFGGRRE